MYNNKPARFVFLLADPPGIERQHLSVSQSLSVMVPALPWSVGPLPIALTAWSAYVCGEAFFLRKPVANAVWLGVFLLPAGICASIAQSLFNTVNQLLLLIVIQLTSAITSMLIVSIVNRRHGIIEKQKVHVDRHGATIAVVAFSIVLFFINTAMVIILYSAGSCDIAKCKLIEMAVGERNAVFGFLYMASIPGSIITWLILTVAVNFWSEK